MSAQTKVDLVQIRKDFTPKADLDEIRCNYDYDMERFLKYSSTHQINNDPVSLASFLTSAYHSLEKGLTMEQTRAGFGARKIPGIINAINELERAGYKGIAICGARGCLRNYVAFHDKNNLPLPTGLEKELRSFVDETKERMLPGGSIHLTRNEIESATDFDYAKFVRTRCSVRNFTGESIDPETIRQAVSLSIKTPRTCNREMRKVYAAYEPKLREHLLSYHHGNRGFGHKLGAVLIVTVDLREFDMIGERNQSWIDGGLFSMSLIYALHASRLGTCMLNWSEDYIHDQSLRKEFAIPDNEVIITLIGVGHLHEKFEVTASPAPSVDEVLTDLRS